MTADAKAELKAELMKKIALGGGGVAGGVVVALLTLSPESVKAIASIGMPGALTISVACCVGLVWRGMNIVERLGHQGVGAVREMAEAHRGLRAEVGTISSSLKDLAEFNNGALEAIQGSLGSLHGKVDEIRKGPR